MHMCVPVNECTYDFLSAKVYLCVPGAVAHIYESLIF